MASSRSQNQRPALATTFLLAAIAACAGDDGPDGIPEDDPLASQPGDGRRSGGDGNGSDSDAEAAGEVFASYEKVPEDLRRDLGEGDFDPDPSGARNRDPFQSFVIDQPELLQRDDEDEHDRDEICDDGSSVATDYALSDLSLMGIVLRGTTGYALFRDGHGDGHIVRRGECLAAEQAIVTGIGSDYVQLETETGEGGDGEPQTDEKEILLHPDESPDSVLADPDEEQGV